MGESEFGNIYNAFNNSPSLNEDVFGLLSYRTDSKKCRILVSVRWALRFYPPRDWTKEAQAEWREKARQVIRNYFNNQSQYRCFAEDQDCCVCKEGISAEVSLVYSEKDPDFFVSVYINRNIRSGVKSSERRAKLREGDIYPRKPQNTAFPSQIVALHEFGHMLGLSHPGQRLPNPPKPNSMEDYTADISSLMGMGMELRIDDFNKIFCRHITTKKCPETKWKAKEIGENNNI